MTVSRVAFALVSMAGLAAAQNVISVPIPVTRYEVSPARGSTSVGLSDFGGRLKANLDNLPRNTREFVSVADPTGSRKKAQSPSIAGKSAAALIRTNSK